MNFFGNEYNANENSLEIKSFEDINESEMAKNIGIVLEYIDNLSHNNSYLEEYEIQPPNKKCIDNAKRLIISLISEIYSNGLRWIDPYVSSEEEDHILIEWYTDERQLHLEINDNDVEYIAFPTGKADSEMRDGKFNYKNCISHWKWLINEK